MDEVEDAFVYVFDRRKSNGSRKEKIHIGGIFSFDVFLEKIFMAFKMKPVEEFVITTTSRNIINDDDTFVTLIESGDTLYILKYQEQPLAEPVSERIEFQPHYDTLIKSGIYEYYASEGHVNPLPFAFAELIDNALAATVKNKGTRYIELSLYLSEDPDKNLLCVYDNGEGMSSRQLNNWAIYRLSKFNRTERHKRENFYGDEVEEDKDERADAPKSLNSDISWFGVGGKQAIFFIGNSTRIISKPRGSCDVHEFTMSKDEFRRKERNREAIFAGYIRNRKPRDSSHISAKDKVTKEFVECETEHEFTRIIVTGINDDHISFMKNGFDIWTKQLAHIYHYYIHGPEGNTTMSKKRRNIGALDVTVKVTMYNGSKKTTVDLGNIEDDLESKYIRTAADSFEFVAKSDRGNGVVEGILRYHPFLYDKETYPLDVCADDESDDEDCGEPPGRGRRPVFECFWNGRLIPYTFVDDFEWCRVPRKQTNIPIDCFYRISGCLFTNDIFQVSTNKLTFIDLDSKLHDRNTTFLRMILGQEQKKSLIQRQFYEWLRECHEKYDKQVKFLKFSSSIMRNEPGSRRSQAPWTVYKAIEWDGKIFSKGQLVRTQRTIPLICGTIRRFLLYGDYDGDVFAVGGEMEIIQEPQALYGDVRSFPLSKLDRSVSSEAVLELVQDEEAKLPASISLTWPEGDKIHEGQTSPSGLSIGAMSVQILNQNDEPIQKLPSNAGNRKLIMEQKLFFKPQNSVDKKPIELASHVTAHGKNWPYWFKRIDDLTGVGDYVISLQATFSECGSYTYADGRRLPSMTIKFKIKSAPPYKFIVGILESPLRIGEYFDIPLDMQNRFGHSTPAAYDGEPILESEGLDIKYGDVEIKGNTLIVKDVVALGKVMSQQGKSFQMTVIIPGLQRESQTLKVRLLPGTPHQLRLVSFSDGYNTLEADEDNEHECWYDQLECQNSSDVKLGVEVVDLSGNITLKKKLMVQCKFTGASGLPTWTCNCSQSGCGTLSGRLKVKRTTKPQTIKAKIDVPGIKTIKSVEFPLLITPSTKIHAISLFYQDSKSGEDDEPIKLKQGQDLFWEAGEVIESLTYQLFDEANRQIELNPKLASQIKVNWTSNLSSSDLENGILPNMPVPTNVSDIKFCQVSVMIEKRVDFSFNIKPVAGEPAGLKIIVHGDRKARVGMVRHDPISVKLLDNFGNQLHIQPGQFEMIKVMGNGLDEALLRNSVENNQIVIREIQFNEGPIGSREITIAYGNILKEYTVLQLVAGSPVTMRVTGSTDYDKSISVLNGTKMHTPISVELLDGWGNPSPESGVKILLGRDPGLKLTPTPSVIKTDASGTASFPKFTVSGKCGDYQLRPRAVYNRTAIEGPKLTISILPNTETPVSIEYRCLSENTTVTAGSKWPDFEVDVLSEEGTNVTAKIHLCMVIWKGKMSKDKSVPTSAMWYRSVTSNGNHVFENVKASTKASEFSAIFGIVSSATAKSFSLVSQCLKLTTIAGSPCKLCPTSEPGTPTVSNAKLNRVIIRNLTLQLKDNYHNLVGENMSGDMCVTIQPCDQSLKSTEVPRFLGNSTHLNIPFHNGEATLQNLMLQENSPGADGSQYILHCEITSPIISVQPYMLKFLFYNDARKHAQMSALVKQRDELAHAVELYEETFSAQDILLQEIKKNCNETTNKKKKLISNLQNLSVPVATESELQDVERLLKLSVAERDMVLQQPRRQCVLPEYQDGGSEVLGKIGHLAFIEDADVARVLSWHMAGDMDCLITTTTKKAREVHRITTGSQQILPMDSIYRKNLSNWNTALPHGTKIKNLSGNPVYARHLLQFPKNENQCKIVFGMLLGDTIIIDDLDSANDYRKMVVKHTYCPTILTRNGNRIRSNGKFGGNQNRAPSMEKLRGVVFGAPISSRYYQCCKQIELLNELYGILDEAESASEELSLLEESLGTDEMKKKKAERDEAKQRLKEVEKQIDLHKPTSRQSVPPRQKMESDKPKRKRRKR
ncbi:unnamed protein product [Clavelina lepadiformis]|uniref:SMC hinge domain-containing protein n=1 Tax=Clavelina lepadiformis TaxID=159417 RepID=A0ABP0EY83_CLALP